jgi:hypothetical protein
LGSLWPVISALCNELSLGKVGGLKVSRALCLHLLSDLLDQPLPVNFFLLVIFALRNNSIAGLSWRLKMFPGHSMSQSVTSKWSLGSGVDYWFKIVAVLFKIGFQYHPWAPCFLKFPPSRQRRPFIILWFLSIG